MQSNLFVRSQHYSDLASFAKAIAEQLGLEVRATRESDNYVDGEYVVAHSLGVLVKVALADDSEFPDYQFWISFKIQKAWVDAPEWLNGLADLIAKQLALEGYDVAHALDYGRIGGKRILYSRRCTSGALRDQLEIRKID